MSCRILIATLLLSGCAFEPVLVPDRGARIAAGTQTVAYAESAGVRAWVDGAAWQAQPAGLEEMLTPVAVTLDNHSGRPLRIAYAQFGLQGSSGFRYAALASM